MNEVVTELVGLGIEPTAISIVAPHPASDASSLSACAARFRGWHPLRFDNGDHDGVGPLVERAERMGPGGAPLLRALSKEGIPDVLARTYLVELDTGAGLVSARVANGRVGRAIEIMNRHMLRTVATAGADIDVERPSVPAPPASSSAAAAETDPRALS
jgi:hypothetical protein